MCIIIMCNIELINKICLYYKVVNSTHDEVYSLQQYVIMFVVSNLWQVDYSLRIHRFPPPIQLTATI